MAGLMSAMGCGSLRQPVPLAGRVETPTEDAGQPPSPSPPDASSPGSPDARTVDPTDAAISGAGRDAGAGEARAPDSGSLAPGTVVSPLVSTVVAENVGTIDALAIDGATLYGLTDENAVWVLEAGSTVPRLLAQDAAPVGSSCGHDSRLAFNASDLFWLARPTAAPAPVGTVLHRTERSGSSDTLMATGVASAPYPMVAADDTHVFWIEEAESSDGNPGGVVRTLPVDAAPGTAPTTLVPVKGAYDITAMTLAGPMLYWTSVFNYTTVPMPQLYADTVSDLLAPQPPTPTYLGESWWVYPHDGDLYVDTVPSFEHLDLARRLPDGSTVNLAPIEDADNIVFVDDWAVVSVPAGSCGNNQHQLVAVPTATPGGPIVQLADDLSTPAVLGTVLAFVDITGQVHTSTLGQIRGALAASR
jgi:hypothetical protein